MNNALPDGYYAVPAPDDPSQITYWRMSSKGQQHGLKPWPHKASYGPVLYSKDVPTGLCGQDRQDWITRWAADVRWPWHAAIRDAIASDVPAAAKRFADLTIRCCCCGRTLTEDYSKVVGIGPECRSGVDPSALAHYLTPQVGRIHARHLTQEEGS